MLFILYNKKGEIVEATDHGNIEIDTTQILREQPTLEILEITREKYQEITGKLEHYRITSGEIVQKSVTEIVGIKKVKDDWERDNTITGLRQQIAELSIKVAKIVK